MASIENIGTNALLAFQRAMATTGHNIANATTEGYSRQRTSFATQPPQFQGGSWMGSGVRADYVERVYDDFIAGQVRTSQSATSRLETLNDHLSRIDTLLARPESGLDSALQGFFNSMQGLADDPSSIAARHSVISETGSLVDRFRYLGGEYSTMRQNLNQELSDNITALNGLADAVANINQTIVAAGGSADGRLPNDLLDQRETLVKEIAKFVDVSVVEQSNGALNLFVGKGQTLVIGNNAMTFSVSTNPTDSRSPDISIQSIGGSVVVTDQISGGRLGGLMEFRTNYLDTGQNQLGLAAVGVVSQLNSQHELGVDLTGTAGGSFFQDFTIQGQRNQNNSGTGAVSLTFSDTDISDVTTSDYELVDAGAGNYTLTRLSDGTNWIFPGATPPTIDGFNLTIAAGSNPGDSFLIQPTRQAAEQITSLIRDPVRLAAAGSLRSSEATDANGNPLNTGDAGITQASTNSMTGIPLAAPISLTFTNDADGAGNPGFTITNGPPAPDNYILYDPATSDIYGKGFPDSGNPNQFVNFGGLSFEFAGTPAVGDQFLIGNNSSGTGDNRNALSMAGIQNDRFLTGGTNSLQEEYSQLVSFVGAETRHVRINYQSQEGLLKSNEAALSSVNGVNLDEEAANLIKYQQAYQAAAQVLSVSRTLFDTLLGAVRR